MKKTTITIVVEHYEDSELYNAFGEIIDRIAIGYTAGHYFGENDVEVDFKIEEVEA